MIAKRIQKDLFNQNLGGAVSHRFIDGDFGGDTVAAVQKFQSKFGLPATGAVDDATWHHLTSDALPSVFERSLQLTAWFEGHGFTLAQGNFDGAGITWGVIGYTLRHGELQAQLQQAEADMPGTLQRNFSGLYPELQRMLSLPRAAQLAWADALTLAPKQSGNLPPDWRDAFARLGQEPKVKARQIEQAYRAYFLPAARSARAFGLTSELGVALAFDVHVQNGSFKASVIEKASHWTTQKPEAERREDLANWVADASTNVPFRSDVRMRKLCIAQGGGAARGLKLDLTAWGLSEWTAV